MIVVFGVVMFSLGFLIGGSFTIIQICKRKYFIQQLGGKTYKINVEEISNHIKLD